MSRETNVIQRMQSKEVKQVWRNLLDTVSSHAFNQIPECMSLYGLPSTDWTFEKMIQKKRPDASIIGVENGIYPPEHPKHGQAIFPDVKANAPAKAITVNGGFDETLNTMIDLASNGFPLEIPNFVAADYCGFPVQYDGNGRYSYPHFTTFINYAKYLLANGKKGIWIGNFNCNLRVIGGKQDILPIMGGNSCSSVRQAIRNKLSMMLSMAGLRSEIHEIVSVHYQGGSRTFMYTIGFAIGFKPAFDCSPFLKLDWTHEASPQNKAWITRHDKAVVKTAKTAKTAKTVDPKWQAAGKKAWETRMRNLAAKQKAA